MFLEVAKVPQRGPLAMLPPRLSRYQPLVDHLIELVVDELTADAEKETASGTANIPEAADLNTCPLAPSASTTTSAAAEGGP